MVALRSLLCAIRGWNGIICRDGLRHVNSGRSSRRCLVAQAFRSLSNPILRVSVFGSEAGLFETADSLLVRRDSVVKWSEIRLNHPIQLVFADLLVCGVVF